MPAAVVPEKRNILLRPRLYLGEGLSIGPGKIELLRALGRACSISAAARELGMPYKRAWLLIDSLNQGFGQPVAETAIGGKGGGGARLTPLGERLVDVYDRLQARLNASARDELAAFMALLDEADPPR
jgi:molybdate transport system regulatory protein